MTKQTVTFLAVLLGTTGGTVSAQEPARPTGPDILRQVVENESDSKADFRIESNRSGEIVSAHDVRHDLNHFYEEDVVSAFFHEHPVIALALAVSISLGLTILLRMRSLKLGSRPADS